MVAHLVTLKLRLLRNGLRRSTWQVVSLAIALVYGLGAGALGVAGLVALRAAGAETAGAALALGGSALVLGWAVVPLIAFGADATLDPSRLAPFPLPPHRLVAGLLLVGLVGVPGLVTTLLGLATLVTWSRGAGVLATAVTAAVLGVATCVAASRTTTTALAAVLAGRRAREAAGVAAVVLAIAAGPAVSSLSGAGVDADAVRRAGAVLGWTPLGWAWTAPAEVATGHTAAGLGKLLLAAGGLAALLLAWSAALQRALVSGPGSSGGGRRRAARGSARAPSGGLLARLEERGPAGAVAARGLRYWRRDTRYLVGLVGVVAFPVVLVLLAATTPAPAEVAELGVPVVLAGVLGWSAHDDVAYDGTAVWMHLAAGVPGRADRAGRALGLLIWAVPLTVVAAVVGTGLSGRWALLPAVLGASVGMLGAGTGVSAVASALVPYPVPDPGANPFAARPGTSVTMLLAQLVTATATGVLSIPVLALLGVALALSGAGALVASVAALVVGAGTAVAAVALGVSRGGAVFDRRGAALLAALAR